MSGIVGTSHSKSKVIGRSLDTAKAWIKWDNAGSIERKFGIISSITDTSNGFWGVNFSAFASVDDWVAVSMTQNRGVMSIENVGTNYVDVRTFYDGNTDNDYHHNCLVLYGK